MTVQKGNHRQEIDPFQPCFVLCEKIVMSGMVLSFGDPVPDYTDLFHLHTHYGNGVVGHRAELDALVDPVELYQSDPLMPIAKHIACPHEEKDPIQKDDERGMFSIENAKLLKTKKDLAGYAKEFNIELKHDRTVTIKKMLENLEEEAKSKGLIK